MLLACPREQMCGGRFLDAVGFPAFVNWTQLLVAPSGGKARSLLISGDSEVSGQHVRPRRIPGCGARRPRRAQASVSLNRDTQATVLSCDEHGGGSRQLSSPKACPAGRRTITHLGECFRTRRPWLDRCSGRANGAASCGAWAAPQEIAHTHIAAPRARFKIDSPQGPGDPSGVDHFIKGNVCHQCRRQNFVWRDAGQLFA
jgi:hypothetical protein